MAPKDVLLLCRGDGGGGFYMSVPRAPFSHMPSMDVVIRPSARQLSGNGNSKTTIIY